MSEVTPELITALTESISRLTNTSQEMKKTVEIINDRLEVVERELSTLAEKSFSEGQSPPPQGATALKADAKGLRAQDLGDPGANSERSTMSAQI